MAICVRYDELKKEIDALVAENEELKQLVQLLRENQELKSILSNQYNENTFLPALNSPANYGVGSRGCSRQPQSGACATVGSPPEGGMDCEIPGSPIGIMRGNTSPTGGTFLDSLSPPPFFSPPPSACFAPPMSPRAWLNTSIPPDPYPDISFGTPCECLQGGSPASPETRFPFPPRMSTAFSPGRFSGYPTTGTTPTNFALQQPPLGWKAYTTPYLLQMDPYSPISVGEYTFPWAPASCPAAPASPETRFPFPPRISTMGSPGRVSGYPTTGPPRVQALPPPIAASSPAVSMIPGSAAMSLSPICPEGAPGGISTPARIVLPKFNLPKFVLPQPPAFTRARALPTLPSAGFAPPMTLPSAPGFTSTPSRLVLPKFNLPKFVLPEPPASLRARTLTTTASPAGGTFSLSPGGTFSLSPGGTFSLSPGGTYSGGTYSGGTYSGASPAMNATTSLPPCSAGTWESPSLTPDYTRFQFPSNLSTLSSPGRFLGFPRSGTTPTEFVLQTPPAVRAKILHPASTPTGNVFVFPEASSSSWSPIEQMRCPSSAAGRSYADPYTPPFSPPPPGSFLPPTSPGTWLNAHNASDSDISIMSSFGLSDSIPSDPYADISLMSGPGAWLNDSIPPDPYPDMSFGPSYEPMYPGGPLIQSYTARSPSPFPGPTPESANLEFLHFQYPSFISTASSPGVFGGYPSTGMTPSNFVLQPPPPGNALPGASCSPYSRISDSTAMSPDLMNFSRDFMSFSPDFMTFSPDLMNVSRDLTNVSRDLMGFSPDSCPCLSRTPGTVSSPLQVSPIGRCAQAPLGAPFSVSPISRTSDSPAFTGFSPGLCPGFSRAVTVSSPQPLQVTPVGGRSRATPTSGSADDWCLDSDYSFHTPSPYVRTCATPTLTPPPAPLSPSQDCFQKCLFQFPQSPQHPDFYYPSRFGGYGTTGTTPTNFVLQPPPPGRRARGVTAPCPAPTTSQPPTTPAPSSGTEKGQSSE